MALISAVKIRIITAALCISMAMPSFAFAEEFKLQDINSGVAVNDLKYPTEAWGAEFLKIYEMGPVYLAKDEALSLEPPPANDSKITVAELEILRGYEKNARDAETVNIILEENGEDPYISIFSRAGRVPDNLKNESVEKALRAAINETGYFLLREKLNFARARPKQLTPELTLVIETPRHSAYPSGHAGQSYAGALVLAKLDPANEQKYIQMAKDVAQRREIAGVHYPSDSVAGQKIAEQVIEKLMKVPAYEKLFQEAKASIVSH